MAASLTREEVARHSSPEDAWIIVDGDVYDVSKFSRLHPGGKSVLLKYAGKDATEDFFGLHRLEVLDKYAKLKKGRIADAGPPPLSGIENASRISGIAYAEPAHMQGISSPYFNESHVALRKAVRRFIVENLLDEALQCEKTGKAPSQESRYKLAEAGITAMVHGPGDHLNYAPNGLMGGIVKPADFDYFHEMIIHEERSRNQCPGYEDGLDAANAIGVPVIIKYGPKWMQDQVIPAVYRGDEVVALAISEAFAGSDVANLRTEAEADGEDYIVTGTKKWITGGMLANWFVTAVRTGGPGHGGISMMLIPRSDEVETTPIKSKYSSSAGTAYITFEGARVPKKNVFSAPGKGFQIIVSNFNHERWFISVIQIARARVCTEETFKWAMQRKIFGKQLVEQPVIREKLAQNFAGVESLTALLHEITYTMTQIGPQSAEVGARIALLKYQTTRMCHLVADNAVQILGGRGVTMTGMGRVVETFHRTYKVPAVYGGSEEIMADLSVRHAIKTYPKLARL